MRSFDRALTQLCNQLLTCVISLYSCTPKTHICTRYLARCNNTPYTTLHSIPHTVLYYTLYYTHYTLYYTHHTLYYTTTYTTHTTPYTTQCTILQPILYYTLYYTTPYTTHYTILHPKLYYTLYYTPYYTLYYTTRYTIHHTTQILYYTLVCVCCRTTS